MSPLWTEIQISEHSTYSVRPQGVKVGLPASQRSLWQISLNQESTARRTDRWSSSYRSAVLRQHLPSILALGTCAWLDCDRRLILHDCGYATPSLYQLILRQLGCLQTLLFHPFGARMSLQLLSPMEKLSGTPSQEAQSWLSSWQGSHSAWLQWLQADLCWGAMHLGYVSLSHLVAV